MKLHKSYSSHESYIMQIFLLDQLSKLYQWSAAYGGIIVFGLQKLVRDYPALKEKLKMSLEGLVRDRSDTGYQVSAKTTPTNLLRNAQSPLRVQNIGMT